MYYKRGVSYKALGLLLLLAGSSRLLAGDTHWLEFNPNAYATEFFTENGKMVGSCGAAAIVLVEHHINLKSSIATSAVPDKNKKVKNCSGTFLDGKYYISSLTCLKSVLEADGYTVVNQTTTSKTLAVDRIFKALGNKHWVIILSRYNFSTSTRQLGHFYPVYGGNKTAQTSTSTLNVIEDFNSSYDPSKPNWSTMYKTGKSLDSILASMLSASSMGNYNILEVYKK